MENSTEFPQEVKNKSIIWSNWWLSGKESACQCWKRRFNPWVGKIPWKGKWQPTPVFLPGQFHGQKSLAGYSSWGHRDVDTTQRLTFTFSQGLKSVPSRTECQDPWGLEKHKWSRTSRKLEGKKQELLNSSADCSQGLTDLPQLPGSEHFWLCGSSSLHHKSSSRQYRNEWAWLFANNYL